MRFLDKHSAREKELRRLGREVHRLRRAQGNAPIVPLECAIQRGWVKTYVLEAGIDRRPDAQIFRTILAAVNRRVWARERSFVHHRTHQPVVLRPRIVPFREMEKLGWPASHRRLFGLGTWKVALEDVMALRHCDRYRWGRMVHGYKLVHTWWLREDVQPYLITHQRVALPDVESRLARIESYFMRTHGWDRLGRLAGRSRWWRHLTKTRAEYRARQSLIDDEREATPD